MTRLHSIPRLLRRFAQLDYRKRLLLAEAAFGLLAARLALIFISFPRLARRFGTLVSAADPRLLQMSADPNQALIAVDVGWAVTRAARYAPLKAVCLPQAMAAHRMLRRRGVASVMHFGAAKGRVKPLATHAWLDAAGVEVTGYPVAEQVTEIASFV
jgi:transglutaminase superfamily protein